jgi:elongation factor G
VEVSLNWFETTKFTSDTIVEAAAASCIRQALQETTVVLLEPIVRLEIIVDARYQSRVSDDLNRRRFQLESMDHKQDNKILIGLAPLGELMGYSTALRTLSSGLGTFSMQFSHYQKVMNPYEEEKIATQVRGF